MNARALTSGPVQLEETRVRDAMHEGVLSCSADTPLSAVAELMAGNGVHCVVVTEADELGVWGVISDLDLVAAAGVRDLDDSTTCATPAASCPRAAR